MKRELILIRHTKSDREDFSLSDFDRPLRKDRTDDAKRMAGKLKALKLHPDLILCSPALRTRQTAEYFCDKLKYGFDNIQFEKNIYEATEDEILQLIGTVDSVIKTLVLIGHNPSLTYFAKNFFPESIEEIPTTGVVWFEFENVDWKIGPLTPCTLQYFLTPKTI